MRYGPNREPSLSIDVFYTAGSERRSKHFTCPRKARSFYAAKFKAGAEPELKAQRQ